MQKVILGLFFLAAFFLSNAQDDYHTNLDDLLQNDYDLPAAEWVLFDNEIAILNDAAQWGSTNSIQAVNDQIFSRKVHCVVNNQGNNPWDAGWFVGNNTQIQQNDKVLMVFYLRSVNGTGEVSVFAENSTTFAKEVFFNYSLTEEWRRYVIPFASSSTYNIDRLNFGFHLANKAQTIEFGGFTVLTYRNQVPLSALPSEINNEFYDGYEEDAPWRSDAANRIEQLRKADLTIQAEDLAGNPVPNAAFDIRMLRHKFDFGTAVTASRFNGNNAFNAVYQNKVINLDGEGHGFNTVVFENDLKWDAWEEEWFVNKDELVNAIAWLRDQGLKIRGHALVWPGSQYLPNDIPNNLGNIPYLQDRINDHLEEVLTFPGVAGQIDEWDVLNEVVVNTTLANAFSASPDYTTGRELYVEIFNKARELDPNIGLWLNDYITITLGQEAGSPQYEALRNYIGELVDAGVDIEGVGFQCHVGGAPNGIPSVLATFDDFYNEFGLKAKVTEFDLPTIVDQELASNYLRDILTATYSHPSMDGFLFWNFWDGATWQNAGANFFRNDWTETQPLDTYVDLLFNQWWTEEELIAASNGEASTRGFKGTYEISYVCDGSVIRDTIDLHEAMNYTISCDNLSTSLNELVHQKIQVYPNPNNGQFIIEKTNDEYAEIRLYDLTGRLIYQNEMNAQRKSFYLDQFNAGFYLLEIVEEEQIFTQKIRIE